MSATTTSTSATASSSCAAKLYEIPTHDAACAMPIEVSNSSAVMKSCCSSASVVSYDDCDYYCLAVDQDVGTLAECLIKGSKAGDVWCNTNSNATATATGSATASETGKGKSSATGTSSSTSTSSGSTASSTEKSAAINVPVPYKTSLAILTLVFFGLLSGPMV